jgi:hypothetical protein
MEIFSQPEEKKIIWRIINIKNPRKFSSYCSLSPQVAFHAHDTVLVVEE